MQSIQYYIAHLDLDCYFCQVHSIANNIPSSQPLVVQQQYDIISVNYPARDLDIYKHQSPKEIKTNHPNVTIAQAHWTGAKVSYQPYRSASYAIFTLVKESVQKHSTVPVHFERSSIDEGYLIFQFQSDQSSQPHSSNGNNSETDSNSDEEQQIQTQDEENEYVAVIDKIIHKVRKDVFQALGFHISAGIGPTKLLAKLASKDAKPNNQTSLTLKEYFEDCAHMTLGDLPMFSRKVDQTLKQNGIA